MTLTIGGAAAERVVELNAVARRVIESRHGMHKERVFSYRGKPLGKLYSSACKRAWKAAKLPTEPGILKGVHNLRQTFGRRLRSAGIPLETRKALLGHANGDITTHYSAAQIDKLISASESIVSRCRTESPNLMLVRQRNGKTVGKVAELKKGITKKIGQPFVCYMTDSLQIIPAVSVKIVVASSAEMRQLVLVPGLESPDQQGVQFRIAPVHRSGLAARARL